MASAVIRTLESGWFVQGSETKEFEKSFSQYVGARFGVGMNSGSDALYLAVRALGIGSGDEVITVSQTFVSTVDAIVRNGANPVFVDINPDDCCIDADKVKEKLNERTKAIIPVHLYGHPSDMDAVNEIAHDHGLYVIEDACQAHGSRYKGRKVGAIGDIGCFSFYPTKNLGAYGDAGIVVTNDQELSEKVRKLSNYGQSSKYYYDTVGVNSRLDEVQAAVLNVKLRHLEEWNNRRRVIAARYREHLSGTDLILPQEKNYAFHIYHQYGVRHAKRDELRTRLSALGVDTNIHYPVPVHMQESYRGMSHDPRLAVTELVSKTEVSLPMFPQMTDNEIAFVSDAVKKSIANLS